MKRGGSHPFSFGDVYNQASLAGAGTHPFSFGDVYNQASLAGAGAKHPFSFGDVYNQASLAGAGTHPFSFGDVYNQASLAGAGTHPFSFGDVYNQAALAGAGTNTFNGAALAGAGLCGGFKLPPKLLKDLRKYATLSESGVVKLGHPIYKRIIKTARGRTYLKEKFFKTNTTTSPEGKGIAHDLCYAIGLLYLRDSLASAIEQLSRAKSKIRMPRGQSIEKLRQAYARLVYEIDQFRLTNTTIWNMFKSMETFMGGPRWVEMIEDHRSAYAPSSVLGDFHKWGMPIGLPRVRSREAMESLFPEAPPAKKKSSK